MLLAHLLSIFASGIAGKVTHRPCRVPAPREVYFVGTSKRGATPAVILLPTCIFPHMLTCGSRWFVSFHREGPGLVIGLWLACLVMLG
jgi:hypothetical protein